MDRSIIRASFRACVVTGNRKPSRADSVSIVFVQVDPRRPLCRGNPRKILESFSKEIEGADVYFDAPASRLFECVNAFFASQICRRSKYSLEYIKCHVG